MQVVSIPKIIYFKTEEAEAELEDFSSETEQEQSTGMEWERCGMLLQSPVQF